MQGPSKGKPKVDKEVMDEVRTFWSIKCRYVQKSSLASHVAGAHTHIYLSLTPSHPSLREKVKRWARQGREARLSQRRVDADDSSISGQSHDDEEAHADYEDLDGFIVESEEGEEQQDDFPVRCVCGATTPGRDAEYVPSTCLIAFLGGVHSF